jgi:hypothetical protein
VAEAGVGGVGGVLWGVLVPVYSGTRRIAMSDDWSKKENALLIADYVSMLAAELRGELFNKTAHRVALRLLNGRSEGSIERSTRMSALS